MWTGFAWQIYTQWALWDSTIVTAKYDFNETYEDSSGNNNLTSQGTGNLFNTTSFVTGNASWQGDGNGYATNLTPSAMPLGNADFTVSMWISPAIQPSTDGEIRIGSLGDADGCGVLYENLGMAYVDVSGTNRLRATGCGYTAEEDITLTTDDWYLVVFNFNASNDDYDMFVNNTFLGTGALAVLNICAGTSDADCEIDLGTYTWAKSAHWQGRVDDFRIHTKVLNSTERDYLWNSGNGNINTNLSVDPAIVGNVAPSVTLQLPSNDTVQYGNASINFTFYVSDDDNASLIDAGLILDSTIINTSSTANNNTNVSYFYLPTSDCKGCGWFANVSDGTDVGTADNFTINIDVDPYNTSLTTSTATPLNNQTTAVYGYYNYTLDDDYVSSGNCDYNISGSYSAMTFDTGVNRWEYNYSFPFGSNTYTVNCSISNGTARAASNTIFVDDGLPPIPTVVAPSNNTQTDAATYVINVTFQDNSTVASANVTLFNGTANAVYALNLTTNGVTVPLVQDIEHYWNITFVDNESNSNSSLTYLLIEDSTNPDLTNYIVPSTADTNTVVNVRILANDTWQNHSSISSVVIEVQQPAGSRTNYTATSDTSLFGYNYLAQFTVSAIGTWTVTNFFVTDVASNVQTNSTTENIAVTTPPAGGGGGGGGGGGETKIITITGSRLNLEQQLIDTIKFIYNPTGQKRIFRVNISSEQTITSCEASNTESFTCEPAPNGVIVTFETSDDKELAQILTSDIIATDEAGQTVTIPFTARIWNFGAYFPTKPIKSTIEMPFIVKSNGTSITGIRYLPFILGATVVVGGGSLGRLIKKRK